MRKILILSCFLLSAVYISAQQTYIYKSPESDFKLAIQLFENQQYSTASELFSQVQENITDKENIMYADCFYFIAVCSYELLNTDAEYKLQKFINSFPENARKNSAKLYLANLYFRDKKYKRSLELYKEIDKDVLSQEEQLEFNFKYGFSAFSEENFSQASYLFSTVKDSGSPYASASTYYFAHIAYDEKNYNTALEHFKKLLNDNTYKDVVPYYIIQILYVQKKYDELATFAQPYVEKAQANRLPEIIRLTGEAFFNLKNYQQSLPYFEKYKELVQNRLSPDEFYKLGYIYYSTGQYQRAIIPLQEATKGNDTLAQNAQYHLGYCYVKTENKQAARISFQQAYRFQTNQIISEDAMFHFAKLSYELSLNPFNEAINALIDYIENYPKSFRIDEAYEYLTNLYVQSKNYKDAMSSIERIKNPNEKLNIIYQKIAFYRAVELFNDRKYKEAIETFNKSLKNPYDRTMRAESTFWKGEAYYQMKDYKNALLEYQTFVSSPGSFSSAYFLPAQYNIGYCYFQKKDYERAMVAFRTFLDKTKNSDDATVYDANIRLGDCYFAQKRYNDAITSYSKSIKQGIAYADYALLQKGFSKGLLNDNDGKIADLSDFIKMFPKSPYMADVIFELGNTFLITKNNDKAIEHYKIIISKYPNSSYRVKAMLRVGLIYYNNDDNNAALTQLKQLNKEYLGTEEAKEALGIMRNIFTELNQVEDFFTYVKELSGSSVAVAVQDTLTYIAAENAYMKNDCDAARKGFDSYIKNFENGTFVLNAYFYRAECDYVAERFNQALNGYEYVINKNWNKFSETALLKAAKICYTNRNWFKSANYYKSLEEKGEFPENVMTARIGYMRSLYNDRQFGQAILAANRLIESPKVNEENIVEARAIIAKSAMENNDIPLALSTFAQQKKLNSEYGAEAFYYIAYIHFKSGQFEESEKDIFEFINTLPSYEYWIAKAFILLADNYLATDNVFQAKHTLKSIIENYEGSDLVEIARQKLADIEKKEKEELKKIELPEEIEQPDK